MFDNSRVPGWLWGTILALVYHSAWGQAPIPPHFSSGDAALRNATNVCTTVSIWYASSINTLKGGDLPFAYGVAPVAGAPYSAVGVTDSATTFVDGNRVTRRETTRFFRDSQGRTRVEHTSPPPGAASSSLPTFAIILINDPVSGECYVLDIAQKIAHEFSTPNNRGAMHPPIELGVPSARLVIPGFDIAQGAFAITAAYSSPEDQVSLGNKIIDGIPVVGTRLKHRIRTGDYGNDRPILVTVEQWFSRDLGVTIEDIQHTTIGGEINYRLQQITRSEPDPALFQVPAGYTRKLERTPAFGGLAGKAPAPKVMFARPPPPPPRRYAPVPCPAKAPPGAQCMGEVPP